MGDGRLTPRLGRFTPRKETRYPLYGRLDGLQGRSERVQKFSPTPKFFFALSCTLFILHPYLVLAVDSPASCLLSLPTTHNTNIPAPGGIRTRNPSKRPAADPRLRPLGHWNRQFRSPDRLARIHLLYRLSNPGPQSYVTFQTKPDV